MTKIGSVAIILMAIFLYSPAMATEQVSGINHIVFFDSQYSKRFVGNGFLIEHQDKIYAVTVKHTLLEAKTPTMNSVSVADEVKEWRIYPNQNPDEYIVLGTLLNRSTKEVLDMRVLQRDWLIFEVKQNFSNLPALKLRDSPLQPGERVTAYGCSYFNAKTCQQDSYQGRFMKMETANLRIAMPDLSPGKLRGLSGSPVLDVEQRVVGIVSNVLRSESGDGLDFAPANLNYLREVLDSL